jgi:hypothetical protein
LSGALIDFLGGADSFSKKELKELFTNSQEAQDDAYFTLTTQDFTVVIPSRRSPKVIANGAYSFPYKTSSNPVCMNVKSN